jgi:hypothetical protein
VGKFVVEKKCSGKTPSAGAGSKLASGALANSGVEKSGGRYAGFMQPNLTPGGVGCITGGLGGLLELEQCGPGGGEHGFARLVERQRQHGTARFDVAATAELARDRVHIDVAI